MNLVVYTDAPLAESIAVGRGTKPSSSLSSSSSSLLWEVTGSAALGSAKALTALSHLLCRDRLHDIVLFNADASGAPIAGSPPLDPSLSAYEQGLGKGSAVYATVNPDRMFTDPARAFWVPLSTAALRFSPDMCSDRNVRIVGVNRRRVQKIGPDSWASSLAVCETTLSNEGVNRWTFRITTEALASSAAAAVASDSKGSPKGKQRSEPSLGNTMYSRGADFKPRHQSSSGGGAKRSVRFSDHHADRHDLYEEDLEEDGEGEMEEDEEEEVVEEEEPGQQAPSLPDEFEGTIACPIAAIGVADENVPLNSNRVHATYSRAYMLHTSTGAFYSGGDPRPIFADSHTYRCVPGMIITMAVDTDRGLLNVLCNGRNVLTAPVARHIPLFPVVELFSHGTIVDLM